MQKPNIVFIELKIASKPRYICDITEKFFDNSLSVTVYVNDEKSAVQLDDLMWTWKQESFVPHSLTKEKSNPEESILITTDSSNLPETDTLILYDPLPAELLTTYKLIIDFAEVYHSDKIKESRIRFKKLRDSGLFDLHFTQLGTILSKKTISVSPVREQ